MRWPESPRPPISCSRPAISSARSLAGALGAAGFDPARRSFFLWLGVAPYLTERAIFATLEWIAGLPGGGEIVFDYANPIDSIADQAFRASHETLASSVRKAGETLQTFFDTAELVEKIGVLGFRDIEDFGPNEIAARFYPERVRPSRVNGAHILRAAT